MNPLLLLLPMVLLFRHPNEPVKTAGAYGYELTVSSLTATPALFHLTITGYVLNPKGERIRFRKNQDNLKTPYRLNLKNGRYTITVESESKTARIVSKVQGIRDGRRMGSASNDQHKTILEAGPGGTYAARGE